MDKIALWISVRVDDWTADLANSTQGFSSKNAKFF